MNEALRHLIETVEEYRSTIEQKRVITPLSPAEIQSYLNKNYDFHEPVLLEDLITGISRIMEKWNLHTIHPGYFGYFNPTVRLASIIGDTLAATYNPNLAVWSHAPAAIEIEQHVLNFFLEKFGYSPKMDSAHFANGGAEANLTAVLAALTAAFPDYGEKGLAAIKQKPVIYVSAEAHDSFTKICHMTGMGRNSLRILKVKNNLKLDVNDLEKQVATDRENGYYPLLVVGTAGTTSAGIIDPLEELAEFCRKENIWFHVDAAWGGAAILSRKLKAHLNGIELSDSITCDAHKWLSVSMAGAMFFCRHKESVERAFSVRTAYMPGSTAGVVEPYVTTVQWSRRFTGLKLFMNLAELGENGYEKLIDGMTDMGVFMKESLRENGWKISNDTPLPVVCFTHSDIETGNISIDTILETIYKRGKVWISKVRLHGNVQVLRACITSYKTQKKNVGTLIEELERTIKCAN